MKTKWSAKIRENPYHNAYYVEISKGKKVFTFDNYNSLANRKKEILEWILEEIQASYRQNERVLAKLVSRKANKEDLKYYDFLRQHQKDLLLAYKCLKKYEKRKQPV